ncbi:MAG: STT3 domain-containing protein, partial [Nanoarchaeota archaeon]|nr:STT3 domain-containing protein [Nanoarchaeota archaeon]
MDINPEIKKYWKDTKNFLSNKKVQNIIFIILFLTTLFIGAYIRLQPVINENLIDSTTGDYTPLALDPYYFLRISETLIETGGELPEIDDMRYQALESGWSNEILPQSTVLIYKAIKIFNSEVTLNFATILNPVIFFILGLIVFALLIFIITKNKWFSLVSSFLLAIIPPYLYRTMAGFSDHESIGMFGFFLALLFFAWGLFYIENKKSNFKGSIILGALAGFSTMFAIASWGGGAKFLFMILPLSFFIIWLTKENKDLLNRLIFYFFWVAGIIISSLFFNYSLSQIVKGYMLSSTGILTFIVLGYILIETIFKKLGIFKKLKLEKKLEKYSELIYFGVLLILGGVVYQIFVGNFFSMIFNLIEKIIYPFGTARVGLTVAENKQPYLNDFIGQIGKVVFYTFLLGAFIVGGKIASGIKKKKLRFLFTGSFAFFIMGILFSRVSQTSIFNGTNIFSKAFFFISFLALAISSIYIYRNSEWKIKTKWIFIAAWMIPMLFAVRSAIRVFFAIVPFIAFMVPLT